MQTRSGFTDSSYLLGRKKEVTEVTEGEYEKYVPFLDLVVVM